MLFAGKMLIIKTLKTSNVLNMVILYSQLEIYQNTGTVKYLSTNNTNTHKLTS